MEIITQDRDKIVALTYMVAVVRGIDDLCEEHPILDGDEVCHRLIDSICPFDFCLNLFSMTEFTNFEGGKDWFYNILLDVDKEIPNIVSELMKGFTSNETN